MASEKLKVPIAAEVSGGKMEFSCGNETFTMKFISNNPTVLTPSVWVDFNKTTFTLYTDTGGGWQYGRSV